MKSSLFLPSRKERLIHYICENFYFFKGACHWAVKLSILLSVLYCAPVPFPPGSSLPLDPKPCIFGVPPVSNIQI